MAGSLAVACATVLAVLGALAPGASAQDLQRDDTTVAPGTFFREDIFLPTDGSPWQATVFVLNGTGAVDVYILRTTDLVLAYPDGAFAPIEGKENATFASIVWRPDDRREAYSLIIDNVDNAHAGDAQPTGAVEVRVVRSPPLHTNPQAAAALSAGTSICAAALAVGTVGVAVYLKRRPRADTDERAESVERIEIPVEVPQRPRGAWQETESEEAEG